jgi:hypothetical protein
VNPIVSTSLFFGALYRLELNGFNGGGGLLRQAVNHTDDAFDLCRDPIRRELKEIEREPGLIRIAFLW